MEYLAFLAPIAFVFSLGAMSYVGALRKEVEQLKGDIDKLKN